jgi:hypothetical protein
MISAARIEIFRLAPHHIRGEIHRLNSSLDITSTERIICLLDVFNDVLIHPALSLYSLADLDICVYFCYSNKEGIDQARLCFLWRISQE